MRPAPAGFDVVCVVGHVSLGRGDEHPFIVACRLVHENGGSGTFTFPHENGGTVEITIPNVHDDA